jgi:hypothetical protein
MEVSVTLHPERFRHVRAVSWAKGPTSTTLKHFPRLISVMEVIHDNASNPLEPTNWHPETLSLLRAVREDSPAIPVSVTCAQELISRHLNLVSVDTWCNPSSSTPEHFNKRRISKLVRRDTTSNAWVLTEMQLTKCSLLMLVKEEMRELPIPDATTALFKYTDSREVNRPNSCIHASDCIDASDNALGHHRLKRVNTASWLLRQCLDTSRNALDAVFPDEHPEL